MNRTSCTTFLGFCVLFALAALPARAQSAPVQPKAPMYTYVADWQIPRNHWSAMPQSAAADKSILDKALDDGTLVGYGNDEDLIHSADGETHDDWWSSMSMAGLIKVLDQLYASGNVSSPALDSATKHWDLVFVSRYYNRHPGPYKTAYTWVSEYQLKSDAPSDSLDTLSQTIVAPLMEKMFADGTIIEYEIDEMAVHNQTPGTFWISWVSPTPEGIDKVTGAIMDTVKAQPLIGPAFGSMTKGSAHRDELLRGEGAYK